MPKQAVCGLLALAALLITITGCSSVDLGENDQLELEPSEIKPQHLEIEQPPETSHQKPEVSLGTLTMSKKPRITTVSSTSRDLQELSYGNLSFTSDLYSYLRTSDANILFSPYSISLALAMIYAGAKGETESQMAETLNFSLPQEKLHPAFNNLSIELGQQGKSAEEKDEKGLRLNIVNATWGQQEYTFLAQYLDTLAEYYGAGIYLLDFINTPEPSRIYINEWIDEQTEGRIEELLPPGSINEATRMVLTNVIYFKASWMKPFEEASTYNGEFQLLEGSFVNVPMMKQIESFGYTKGSNYQAVELLYSGGEVSMVILLPEKGEFRSFEKSLNQQLIFAIQDSIEYRQVDLSMPLFEFDSSLGLKKIFSAMGMSIPFSETADFSGLTSNRDIHISDILHKAYISVDEAGTEATAATGVVMALVGIPEPPIEVTVDSPFIFFIRDIGTGSILFIGRVLDPSA